MELTTRMNLKFWTKHKVDYPFTLQTKPYPASPKPDDVDQTRVGEFLRVPLLGCVMWGFKTQEGLDKFKEIYLT